MKKTGLTLVGIYFVVFLITFYLNHVMHPGGPLLWVLAALPLLPILGVFVVFGRYLRDERDGFKRDLISRCLLWGTAGCLGTDMVENYLRIYGWTGHFPPFTSFWMFFVFMMAAKLSYNAQHRVPADE